MTVTAITADVTGQVASFIAAGNGLLIPEAAVAAAERNILDTLACMIAGSVSEEAEPLTQFLAQAGRGDAAVIGFDQRVPASVAALVNGTLGHALDFDDVLSIMPAHPSTVVLPALLALVPEGTNGRALCEAYVIGVEVGAKIGVAITNGHYRRGWHATGTLAIFSAVAALGRLLNLTEPQIRTAIGIASSMASGLQCNFGTMTKPLHAGWAAQSAVNAVQLALSGLTASQNALEAPAGFFATYGVEASDLLRLPSLLGQPFAVVSPSLSLKKYPCCYALHRAIDAILALRGEFDLSPETVQHLSVRVAPGALRPLRYKVPKSGLEAKFSMEYTLACGILDGHFGLAAYSDEGAQRPEIHALLSGVEAVEDPRCLGDETAPELRSAGTIGFVEVTLTLCDGRQRTIRIDTPTGSPQKPLTADDLDQKFIDCATVAGLDAESIPRVLRLWRSSSTIPDIRAAFVELVSEI